MSLADIYEDQEIVSVMRADLESAFMARQESGEPEEQVTLLSGITPAEGFGG